MSYRSPQSQPVSSPAIEAPLVIESREELIALLSEAAELEHMVLCEYLFAVFSLKRDTSEGITQQQLEAILRWDRIVSAVANQEMLHLALVSHLLAAVGAAPHFARPNFPQYAKYYPPGIQMALRRFGEEALRHFIFLERPEGMDGEDAPGFEIRDADAVSAPARGDEVVPVAQRYATVGHLYRGIERGFQRLVEKYGEQRVFIGPPEAQTAGHFFRWPELIAVTDLASAQTAIETIVEEGEGARGDWRNAHYGKFLQVLDEYRTLKGRDPAFEPARPVLAARSRPTYDVPYETDLLITDPTTARVVDLFNGSYEVMLQILARFFMHAGQNGQNGQNGQSGESVAEMAALSEVAVGLMARVIRPLGVLLSTLSLGSSFPGATTGASFSMYRTAYVLPYHDAARILLHERLLTLAEACATAWPLLSEVQLSTPSTPSLIAIADMLRALGATLEQAVA